MKILSILFLWVAVVKAAPPGPPLKNWMLRKHLCQEITETLSTITSDVNFVTCEKFKHVKSVPDDVQAMCVKSGAEAFKTCDGDLKCLQTFLGVDEASKMLGSCACSGLHQAATSLLITSKLMCPHKDRQGKLSTDDFWDIMGDLADMKTAVLDSMEDSQLATVNALEDFFTGQFVAAGDKAWAIGTFLDSLQDGKPDKDVKLAGKTYETSGTIMSQNYPNTYPNDIFQEWIIKVKPGWMVELTFSAFDVELHSDCDWDWVRIIYQGFDEKFCGTTIPGPFTSPDNIMTIQFRSDGCCPETGFLATWVAVQ